MSPHAFRGYVPAYPKPSQVKREVPVIKVYPSGREVIDVTRREGWEIYRGRVYEMLERQLGICCLYGIAPNCNGALSRREATFDHEHSRGMNGSKREDRIEIDGLWINGACCHDCNGWKGSRKIEYNLVLQARYGGNHDKG